MTDDCPGRSARNEGVLPSTGVCALSNSLAGEGWSPGVFIKFMAVFYVAFASHPLPGVKMPRKLQIATVGGIADSAVAWRRCWLAGW